MLVTDLSDNAKGIDALWSVDAIAVVKRRMHLSAGGRKHPAIVDQDYNIWAGGRQRGFSNGAKERSKAARSGTAWRSARGGRPSTAGPGRAVGGGIILHVVAQVVRGWCERRGRSDGTDGVGDEGRRRTESRFSHTVGRTTAATSMGPLCRLKAQQNHGKMDGTRHSAQSSVVWPKAVRGQQNPVPRPISLHPRATA